MDFLSIKKRANKKLESFMEAIIYDVAAPKVASSASLKNGVYTIKPFGKYTFYFEILLNDEEKFEDFKKSFEKIKIYKDLEDIKIYLDNVIKFYKLSGFVKAPLIEELELSIKEILDEE